MSNSTKLLGVQIKKYRKDNKMSQDELANKATISTTYLGQIERGTKSPTVETLYKVSRALNISLYELFDYDKANHRNDIKTTPKNKIINKINANILALTEDEQYELLKIIKAIRNIIKHKNSN